MPHRYILPIVLCSLAFIAENANVDSTHMTARFCETWMRARNTTLRTLISQTSTFRAIHSVYRSINSRYRDTVMWYYNLSEAERELIEQTISLTL